MADDVKQEIVTDTKKDGEEKKEQKNSLTKEILSWVETIALAVLFAIILTTFVVVNAKVPSASMENTIMTGDKLFANRLAYIFDKPERYDIVVFKFPDDESKLYIKRIIGLPGETVEIRNGLVYINGSDEPLKSDFQREPMVTPDAIYNVPDGCYFMMGDNRNSSFDSRKWNNKFVSEDKILGKAVFRYAPIGSIGLLTDTQYSEE